MSRITLLAPGSLGNGVKESRRWGGKWRGEREYGGRKSIIHIPPSLLFVTSCPSPLFSSSLLPSLPSPSSLLPFFSPSPSSPPPLPHQSHLLECGCGSIKHEHRFDVIVEELTNPVEEHQEVGVGEGIPLCIPRPLHCLVQPDTHIWCVCVRRSGEKGGGDGRKTLTTRTFYRYTEKDYDIEMGGIDQYM